MKGPPGYYATRLDRYGIDVEFDRYRRRPAQIHLPGIGRCRRGLRLENGGCWDAPTETFIERADDHTISGYRYSTGWAKDQRVYFTAEFSKPSSRWPFTRAARRRPARRRQARAERLYGRVGFDTSAGETIYVICRYFAREHRECTPEHAGRASRLGLQRRPQPPTGRGRRCKRCASRLRTTPRAAFSIRRFTTRWSPRPNSAT